jgi:hypothetical protein
MTTASEKTRPPAADFVAAARALNESAVSHPETVCDEPSCFYCDGPESD